MQPYTILISRSEKGVTNISPPVSPKDALLKKSESNIEDLRNKLIKYETDITLREKKLEENIKTLEIREKLLEKRLAELQIYKTCD